MAPAWILSIYCHIDYPVTEIGENLIRTAANNRAFRLATTAHNQACGMVWNPKQIRCDVAHFRANRVINPELERVRERFEAGELTIEVFEQAIAMAERNRAAA